MTDDAFQVARTQIDAEHAGELTVLNNAKALATTALQNGSLSTADREIFLEEYKLINEKVLALFEKRFTAIQSLSQKQFDNYWAEKKIGLDAIFQLHSTLMDFLKGLLNYIAVFSTGTLAVLVAFLSNYSLKHTVPDKTSSVVFDLVGDFSIVTVIALGAWVLGYWLNYFELKDLSAIATKGMENRPIGWRILEAVCHVLIHVIILCAIWLIINSGIKAYRELAPTYHSAYVLDEQKTSSNSLHNKKPRHH